MLKVSGLLPMGTAFAALLFPQAGIAQSSGSNVPILTCSKAILHFTPRGFAFECQTPRNDSNHIMVVRDENFPGRVDHVIEAIKELNARTSDSGRTRADTGLTVTYRRADTAAQAVCNAVRPRLSTASSRCLIAGDVAFR